MVYLTSEWGTANAVLTDPPDTWSGVIRSEWGTANARLNDPDPAGPYRRSAWGTANATLGNESPIPEGWREITKWQWIGSAWVQVFDYQNGHRLRTIQYVGTPSVPPPLGYTRSAWGTANATLGSWSKPAIGLIGTDESAFNAMNAQMGPVRVRRTYDVALPSSWATSKAASDVAAERESLWSWKPSVTGFVASNSSGIALRAAFSAFLDTIPAGHKCVIMAWHEPEDDIDSGTWTLAQWGALQNEVATIIKSKNRPELRTGFCLMGPWTFDTRSGRVGWAWESAVNFNLIDVVGIDPYGTSPSSPANMYSLERLLTQRNSGSGSGTAPSMMEKLRTWGKPISIMEYGKYYEGTTVAPESIVASWIHESYDWMKQWNEDNQATPIEHALWYNLTIINEDTPLTGLEVIAYREIITDSKIAV